MTLADYLKTTTQSAFAEALNVTQGAVSQWLTGELRITAERAKQIEDVTAGKVTRAELRPDIFDAPPKRKAVA